jgi:uncharacterized protein (DUF58 family)
MNAASTVEETGDVFRLDSGPAEVVLRRLQLMVRRKLDGLLHGDYLGLLSGTGSEAGESREYRPGDDVRRMDWPVTARTMVPHIRQTVADRELEAWLAIDLSPSLDFGTARCSKRDLAIFAAAGIVHLVVRGGNRIGAVVTNGEHLSHWPARPGRLNAQALMLRILNTARSNSTQDTNLAELLVRLQRPPRRRGQVVVISDFLAQPGWEIPMRKLAVRHDVLAIEIVDPRELELPDVGVLMLEDAETGEIHEVQTASKDFRSSYQQAAAQQRQQIATVLRTAGAAHLQLSTSSDWLVEIVKFVVRRRQGSARGHTGGLVR